MYQRSADMLLGVPFNVFSYSVLTSMIAQVCGLKPGSFNWTGGDCHIYENHFQYVEKFLQNEPTSAPVLHINPAITDIDGFTMKDFSLVDYSPHPNIKNIPMAV